MTFVVSPSTLDSGFACLRKYHFRSNLGYAVTLYPWQETGIQIHKSIEEFSLFGREPEDEFYAQALQLVKPLLRQPPYNGTEIEIWSARPRNRAFKDRPNAQLELQDWCGRKDFAVHMYTDYWPDPNSMDTWDWKVRTSFSFRNVPEEDLRDDPQAVMYQLARSYTLTQGWEEPGTMTWHLINRKDMTKDKVSYTYAQGEALERWHRVLEPGLDIMLRYFDFSSHVLKKLDPVDIPDQGYYQEDRECDKWSGCDYARRCMACGTPVFGVFSGFLKKRHGG